MRYKTRNPLTSSVIKKRSCGYVLVTVLLGHHICTEPSESNLYTWPTASSSSLVPCNKMNHVNYVMRKSVFERLWPGNTQSGLLSYRSQQNLRISDIVTIGIINWLTEDTCQGIQWWFLYVIQYALFTVRCDRIFVDVKLTLYANAKACKLPLAHMQTEYANVKLSSAISFLFMKMFMFYVIRFTSSVVLHQGQIITRGPLATMAHLREQL